MYDTLNGSRVQFRFARGPNTKPNTFVKVNGGLIAICGRKLHPQHAPRLELSQEAFEQPATQAVTTGRLEHWTPCGNSVVTLGRDSCQHDSNAKTEPSANTRATDP